MLWISIQVPLLSCAHRIGSALFEFKRLQTEFSEDWKERIHAINGGLFRRDRSPKTSGLSQHAAQVSLIFVLSPVLLQVAIEISTIGEN